MRYRYECVNASTITLIDEFPSEEGDIGSLVSNEILWLDNRLCPLKSCFSANCFSSGKGLLKWHVMQSLHNTFIQISAFGKQKLWVKFEYVFSDPTCLFVWRECDTWNAITIKLSARQRPSFVSREWYSKRSLFLFIVVQFFSEISKKGSFPNTVISAFTGFVFLLSQDLSCRMTWSRYWCFLNNWSVNVSVLGRKIFWISFSERGISSKGSCKLNILLIVNFWFDLGGPGKFLTSVRFSCSIIGKQSFLYGFCLYFSRCVIFFIHDEYGFGLNVFFP